MVKDSKAFVFKAFFAFIIFYISLSIFKMASESDENYSFEMGQFEIFNNDWYCENTSEFFDAPNFIKNIKPGEELTIKKTLPSDLDHKNCLDFRSFQGSCKVYIDDELRYEYDDKEYRKFSKFPPSAEILVDLDKEDAGKEVKIVLFCENKNLVGSVSEIILGERDTLVRRLLNKYTPMMIIAILLIVLGIICIVVFYLLYRESKRNKYIIYLGMVLAFIGLWIISSSRIRQLFFGDITTLQYLELWLVHILSIPFIFFIDLRCGGRYRKYSNIMLTICYVDFFGTTLLHFSGIYDKAYSLVTGHICIALSAVYFVICVIKDYKTGYKKGSLQITVAFIIFGILGLVDIFKLYLNRQWEIGFYIVFGILWFAFAMLAFSVQDFIAESRGQMAVIAESEAKEQFFATMSHDIRTPINAIIGMNEMIQRETKESETIEYSRDIQRASETLMSIVNNILDFSKIRDGKFELIKSEFLFLPMVADVIKMTSTLAEKKNLKFTTNIDEKIPQGLFGDENAIKRILTNITSNAIKYTKDGTVEFVAKLISINDATNSACIRFEVIDTGMGIKEEDIPHIFDVFSRMDGEKNKNVQGTGLGLAITNALVGSMGSKIEVSSVYGEGSTFAFNVVLDIVTIDPIGEFSLENAKLADEKRQLLEEEKKNFFNDTKTILVVDDTEMNLKVMNKLLKIYGVKVETASSGDECIDKVSINKYDLILLDDMMPNKDGRETLVELQNTKADRIENVPVIILTANAGPGVKDMYLSLGFTDYMSKPVSPDSLNNVLWKYLG